MKVLKVDNKTCSIRHNINFNAGLTSGVMQEINAVNTSKISDYLILQGIRSDFDNNKLIAWCCAKVVEIINTINKESKQQLALPKGIFVKDFEDLNVQNPLMYGFCNMAPVKLFKQNNKIVPEKVLFFNKNLINEKWEDIDEISDRRFFEGNSATDFFLDIFLHEFSHVIHENHLMQLFRPKQLIKKIEDCYNVNKTKSYKEKYGDKVAQICNYALENPLEAVACDMSRIISENIDDNFAPKKNIFTKTPYEKLSLLQRILLPHYPKESIPLNELLRNFWNGKFN